MALGNNLEMTCVGYMQILYALLYGRLEHPWILVFVMGEGPGISYPLGIKGAL